MNVLDCNEKDLIKEFGIQAPTLWNLIVSIVTPDETRFQSKEYQDSLKTIGERNAYFIMNHILKLRGGKMFAARAAMVGIFLDTQG